MTQRKVSKFLVVSTIWGFVTAFLMVKAYDQGYKHGVNNTRQIITEVCK